MIHNTSCLEVTLRGKTLGLLHCAGMRPSSNSYEFSFQLHVNMPATYICCFMCCGHSAIESWWTIRALQSRQYRVKIIKDPNHCHCLCFLMLTTFKHPFTFLRNSGLRIHICARTHRNINLIRCICILVKGKLNAQQGRINNSSAGEWVEWQWQCPQPPPLQYHCR